MKMTYSRNGTKMMSHDLDCNEDTGNPLQEIEPASVALQGRVNNWHTLSSHYAGIHMCNENCNDSRDSPHMEIVFSILTRDFS